MPLNVILLIDIEEIRFLMLYKQTLLEGTHENALYRMRPSTNMPLKN